jgi:hypothetical protein
MVALWPCFMAWHCSQPCGVEARELHWQFSGFNKAFAQH